MQLHEERSQRSILGKKTCKWLINIQIYSVVRVIRETWIEIKSLLSVLEWPKLETLINNCQGHGPGGVLIAYW